MYVMLTGSLDLASSAISCHTEDVQHTFFVSYYELRTPMGYNTALMEAEGRDQTPRLSVHELTMREVHSKHSA